MLDKNISKLFDGEEEEEREGGEEESVCMYLFVWGIEVDLKA